MASNQKMLIAELIKANWKYASPDISGERLPQYLFLGKGNISKTQKKPEEKVILPPQIWRKVKARVLPKNGLKFSNVEKSHTMWEQYMTKYLDLQFLKRNRFSGDPTDKHWEMVSTKVIKADFHGAYLCVIRSILPSYVGLEGIVVLETQNVFQLLGKDDIIRTVQKKLCEFRFTLDGYQFTFFGKYLHARPSTRSVKKHKTQMFNTL